MDFAFSFEMWQSLCVLESENTKDNARFAIAFGLCHNLCAHMWKTQLKIQFAIPCEKSPDYSSIIKVQQGQKNEKAWFQYRSVCP